MHSNPFSDDELSLRLVATRQEMAVRGLDLVLLSAPEHVFYLTGLDHWGYFAPHVLIVAAEGELVLVTRAMEHVAIRNQVRNATFIGHSDSESAADVVVKHLNGASSGKTIGLESASAGLSYAMGQALKQGIDGASWVDITGMLDEMRLVKSIEEQRFMRSAAVASDAGTQAAINAIHDGAKEADVAAECLAAMTRAGGTPPGFGPFLRPSHRMAEEHTTWGDGEHHEAVFLEIAGCVARYNAPMGRLVNIGRISDEDAEMARICGEAFDATLRALKVGARAKDVYSGWQSVVDAAGMPEYRRHHCGYLVGIGFPPAWTGGPRVTGLRHDSDREMREGMTFHLMSWFTETGRGNYFISNTVLLGADGAEVLTTTPYGPHIAP
ncbi:MAG TPA: aminopeptidase P family protein [Gammaproteobacteria bacterium]|jgi:Xaa-Pro dipeptidase|nr:aminopeptidase P family protein [Gammaproteobacteria bacterium]|tara:strand:- start:365 stop:1510 length:1146 start_codon:yes stop_codon:yes gene_type:complete